MEKKPLVGTVPTGKKPCPYGLRDREGNCIPSSAINLPTREQGSKVDKTKDFPQLAPIVVKPNLTIPVRVPAPSTRKISKTPGGFAEKKHALSRSKPLDRRAISRLPERVRTPVSNMRAGDSVYTAGTRSREKIVSPAESRLKGSSKAVGKTTLKVKAGANALAALDVGVTLLEYMDEGKTLWEAASQIPGVYFDAVKDLAAEAYNAVVDKDLIRLGEVVVGAINPTTPVIRAIDYAGSKVGVDNLAEDISGFKVNTPVQTEIESMNIGAVRDTLNEVKDTVVDFATNVATNVGEGIRGIGSAIGDAVSKLPKLW